jgi:hypothetical protein
MLLIAQLPQVPPAAQQRLSQVLERVLLLAPVLPQRLVLVVLDPGSLDWPLVHHQPLLVLLLHHRHWLIVLILRWP